MPTEGDDTQGAPAPAVVDAAPIAAEPVAPATPVAPEPVAPVAEPVAPAAEPVAPAAVETPPAPLFPDHNDFDFDGWDGAALDAFPEALQPWLKATLAKVGANHAGALDDIQGASKRWQGMFEAMSTGEDDPRIAEEQGRTTEWQNKYTELDKAFKVLDARVEQVVQANTDRYVDWFASAHPDVVQDEARFESMATLSEKLNVNWDVALTIQALGSTAVEEAKTRAAAGKDIEDTIELLKLRHGNQPEVKPRKDVVASQALASDSRRPPPAPRPGPVKGTSDDLNTNIRDVVRAALAKANKGSKRRR